MRNIGIILAGGRGTRLGNSALPKQLIKIEDKTVIEYSLATFEANPYIDEIAIVINQDYQNLLQKVLKQNSYQKVKKVLLGGEERYLSSYEAIKNYQNDDDNLIFHDSARPLVPSQVITNTILALEKYQAVTTFIDAVDTIIEVRDGFAYNIPPRDNFKYVQTPQGFKRHIIKKAYDIALNSSNFKATDDAGVVKKYLPEEKIFMVQGSLLSHKITYLSDIDIIKNLLKNTK